MNTHYKRWLNETIEDQDLHQELQSMNEATLEEAFYKSLSFGTGGMRGIIGAGTNRINRYTLAKATYGFAKFLLEYDEKSKEKGVVIAYDNRYKSEEFAKICTGVLGALGIKSYLFKEMRPTPMLSYAVRHLQTAGGIMITASHNPPKYNGVKYYDDDGCQLLPDLADRVIQHVNAIDDLFAIAILPFEKVCEEERVTFIGREIDNSYLKEVAKVALQPDRKKITTIVFTPLHGACREVGLRCLIENGYEVYPVEEQMVADPSFSTVQSPNPEDPQAFDRAIDYGNTHQADVLIATDPDGDRLGIAVKHEKEYIFLNGNQTGAIFIDYLLKTKKKLNLLPEKGLIYNTIVTSDFGATIAESYGFKVHSTLTGFKFIGEQMKIIEDTDTEFLMGYEESYGYVIKDFVRDKDACQAMLLAAEITNELKHEKQTMVDYLHALYDTHGAYREDLVNLVLEGQAGEKRFAAIMEYFRNYQPQYVAGKKCLIKEDYLTQKRYQEGTIEPLNYPKSDVIKFILEDHTWFVLRPSGTEPKLKIYFSLQDQTVALADESIGKLKEAVMSIIDTIK